MSKAREADKGKALGRPCESWLALDNENHEQFGAAMALCEDGSGSCMRTGVCSYDGVCFLAGGEAERQAARKIEAMAHDTEGLVRSVLYRVALELRTKANEAREPKAP